MILDPTQPDPPNTKNFVTQVPNLTWPDPTRPIDGPDLCPTLQSFCYSIVYCPVNNSCSKSAPKFAVRVCPVSTVAMETKKLVLSQFKNVLPYLFDDWITCRPSENNEWMLWTGEVMSLIVGIRWNTVLLNIICILMLTGIRRKGVW